MARDINNVIVVGRLTRDVGDGFSYVGNGFAKASVSLASSDARKQGNEWVEETSFFEVVIWGKTAENLKQYLNKGQQLAVQGKLKQDRWEKDGKKFSKVYIVAEIVELLGGKKESQASSGSNGFQPTNDGFQEDIPFN